MLHKLAEHLKGSSHINGVSLSEYFNIFLSICLSVLSLTRSMCPISGPGTMQPYNEKIKDERDMQIEQKSAKSHLMSCKKK